MEHAVVLAPENPEVLYDLAVIRLAAGKRDASLEALRKSVLVNPKLKKQAAGDSDLESLRDDPRFQKIVK